MAVDIEIVIDQLIVKSVNAKVFGRDVTVNDKRKIDQLVSDKRSAKRIMRELEEKELVVLSEDGKNYSITDKVWDSIEVVEVDPFKNWKTRYQFPSANIEIPYLDVNSTWKWHPDKVKEEAGKAKWLYENQDDIYIYVLKGRGCGDICNTNDLIKVESFGEPLGKVVAETSSMLVFSVIYTTDELIHQVKSFLFERQVNSAMGRNFSWGLSSLEILDPADAELIRHKSNGGLMDLEAFSQNPKDWKDEIDGNVKRCLDMISKQENYLRVLRKVREGIDEMGGMDQFLTHYENSIRGSLKDEEKKAAC